MADSRKFNQYKRLHSIFKGSKSSKNVFIYYLTLSQIIIIAISIAFVIYIINNTIDNNISNVREKISYLIVNNNYTENRSLEQNKEILSRFIVKNQSVDYIIVVKNNKPLVILPSGMNINRLNHIIKSYKNETNKKYIKIVIPEGPVVYDTFIKYRGFNYHIGILRKQIIKTSVKPFLQSSFLLIVLILLIVILVLKTISGDLQKNINRSEASNNRFKMLFNNINSGVVIYEPYNNGEDFLIKDINKSVERIEKVSYGEIVGKKVTEVFPGVKDFGLLKVLKRVWKTGIPEEHPISYYKDNKREGWRKNHIFKLSNTNEIVVIYEDITKQKEAEKKLREKEQQLNQGQKLEAIGRLAGGIAHDFNNILTAIIGYSEILLLTNSLAQDVIEYIKEIKKAAEKASNLTYQLLAFSRKQILKLDVINLNTIIEDTAKMLKRIIGEDIELITVLDPNLSNIKADTGQMVQVLMNLAVNARDAMPEGGKLIIETRNIFLDDIYCKKHPSIKPGEYIMMAVTDTGIGMDEYTKQMIFEPFFTTKKNGKGTGLGLSTVYGIIKQIGGYIWVYSELNRGTVFKIYIPASKLEENNKKSKNHILADLKSHGETMLVVEDEASVLNILYKNLTKVGYEVYTAKNGIEALKVFNKCKYENKNIDLLITDIVMPKMNGKDLYNQLKLISPSLKVLYISGYTDNAIVHNGVLYNNVNFLQKPFNSTDLLYKVCKILTEDISISENS